MHPSELALGAQLSITRRPYKMVLSVAYLLLLFSNFVPNLGHEKQTLFGLTAPPRKTIVVEADSIDGDFSGLDRHKRDAPQTPTTDPKSNVTVKVSVKSCS